MTPATMRGTVNVYRVAEAGYKKASLAPESAGAEGNQGGPDIDRLIAQQNGLAATPLSRTLLAPGNPAVASGEPATPSEITSPSLWTKISHFFSKLWTLVVSLF